VSLIFANPAGWWALLALPAVLAIHFLQERSRHRRTATLFLLEHATPLSVTGPRWTRLRQSIPLWLQLLAALLLAWLLAQPRWIRPDTRQSVVLVLDSTASLSAFRDVTRSAIERALRQLASSAALTEWTLIETDTRRPVLYRGTDPAALLAALQRWNPVLGDLDPAPALRLAQTLVREQGVVVLVTDRPAAVPGDVAVLSAAEPADNTGFAGLTVTVTNGQSVWRALLRNLGTRPREVEWHLELGAQSTPGQRVSLAPGASTILEGPFPAGTNTAFLVASPDRFTLDDRVPLVRPLRKTIAVTTRDSTGLKEALDRIVNSLPDVRSVPFPPEADVVLARMESARPFLPEQPAILFATGDTNRTGAPGWVIATDDPLVREAGWASLVGAVPAGLEQNADDIPLIWLGREPLAVRRRASNGVESVLVNFDISTANAPRLPALVLLVRRFLEEVRSRKVAFTRDHFECNQLLALAANTNGGPVTLQRAGAPPQSLPAGSASLLRAPDEPCHFTVMQGTNRLLEGAAHFADAREADLRQAGPADGLAAVTRAAQRQNSEADPFTPVWILAFLACVAGAWRFSRGGTP
jgi:hypothetical protein